MKILYDHQAFTFQKFGGVSRCFCELILHMPHGVETEISVKQSDNVHLLESHLCDEQLDPISMNFRRWTEKYPFRGSSRIYSVLRKWGILRTMENANLKYSCDKLKEGDFDVFHPTFFDPYFLPLIGHQPWVFTVHDMMPEIFTEYFKKDNNQTLFKRRYLFQADHIIAVSENTKKDLMRIIGVSEDHITVIYHGGPVRERINTPRMIAQPYFLYVGTRNAYKNFPQTLIDFANFHASHPDVMLICTGGSFTTNEKQMIKSLDVVDGVKHINANDEQMKNLYANALAFVYPSLYEGFGMPILEAYAYGCPVLLNNKSCFPEIAADAAIYFDSIEGRSNLDEKMAEIYGMSVYERENIIEKGYARLEKFSWKASADKLSKVYDSVISRQ